MKKGLTSCLKILNLCFSGYQFYVVEDGTRPVDQRTGQKAIDEMNKSGKSVPLSAL